MYPVHVELLEACFGFEAYRRRGGRISWTQVPDRLSGMTTGMPEPDAG
jgi:hypothetical protein